MARYIDADKLIEALQTDFEKEGAKADDMAMSGNADLSVKYSHGQFCYLNAIERIKDVPTADVVPKSEVEKLESEIERLKHILNCYALQYGTVKEQQDVIDKANREFASEIFAEIEFDIHQLMFERDETRAIAIEGIIAQAKKKYAEGEQ